MKLGGLSKVGEAGGPPLVAEGLRHLGRQARLADAAGAGDEAGENGRALRFGPGEKVGLFPFPPPELGNPRTPIQPGQFGLVLAKGMPVERRFGERKGIDADATAAAAENDDGPGGVLGKKRANVGE